MMVAWVQPWAPARPQPREDAPGESSRSLRRAALGLEAGVDWDPGRGVGVVAKEVALRGGGERVQRVWQSACQPICMHACTHALCHTRSATHIHTCWHTRGYLSNGIW